MEDPASTLAERDNVVCKVWGFVTEADWKRWTPAPARGLPDGVRRGIWTQPAARRLPLPVCLIAAGYAQWWQRLEQFFASFRPEERDAVFARNAERLLSHKRPRLRRATRMKPPASTNAHTPLFPSQGRLAFILVSALFVLWGMSNNLTDILVQQFRKSFELSALQAQLVQTAVFLGYFSMALPAALLARRHGYKAGILTGLCLFGVGLLLFWPAAHLGRYTPMLLALFVVGCGSATLETTANPYVAQAGPAHTAERRLNFVQALNPPGTITGVLVGTYFIFSGVELAPNRVATLRIEGAYAAYLHSEVLRVVPTYVTLGCIVLGLACAIAMVRFPDVQQKQPELVAQHRLFPSLASLLRFHSCWARLWRSSATAERR